MINIDSLNSIPQIKHAIRSLHANIGNVNSVLESIIVGDKTSEE